MSDLRAATVDFRCGLFPPGWALEAEAEEAAEAPSEDWMEVTAEMGVNVC